MWKIFILLGVVTGSVLSNECLTRSNGIYPSATDCSSFVMCSGGFETVHDCPEPLRFNKDILVCDWARNVQCDHLDGVEESAGGNATSFDCWGKENGLYPNEEDCHTFIECSNGVGSLFKCPENLIFNPATLVCDWPSENNVCQGTTRTTQQPPRTTEPSVVSTVDSQSSTVGELTENPQPATTDGAGGAESTQNPVTDDSSEEEQSTENPLPVTEDGGSEESSEDSSSAESTEPPKVPVTEESTQNPIESTTVPDTTRIPTTTVAPEFCIGKPNGLYPNPKDCTSFYKCTNQYTFLIPCPAGNFFDPESKSCIPDPSVCTN